jgi:3-isopropylmalate/(R)-2-methylmalate dehydratase small subunit
MFREISVFGESELPGNEQPGASRRSPGNVALRRQDLVPPCVRRGNAAFRHHGSVRNGETFKRHIEQPGASRFGHGRGFGIENRFSDSHIQRMTKSVFTGPVYVVRDNIDTDQIISAQYLNLVPTIAEEYEKLGSYALDGLPASLYPTRYVKPGQLDSDYPIVVAGRNFGCGSSREHAPIAMGSANCEIVLAQSFARIFFRNCVATGELYPCEITERLCEVLKTGDVVTVDLDAATVTVKGTGKLYHFKPLGDVRPVVDAGGLFNFARNSGMIAK